MLLAAGALVALPAVASCGSADTAELASPTSTSAIPSPVAQTEASPEPARTEEAQPESSGPDGDSTDEGQPAPPPEGSLIWGTATSLVAHSGDALFLYGGSGSGIDYAVDIANGQELGYSLDRDDISTYTPSGPVRVTRSLGSSPLETGDGWDVSLLDPRTGEALWTYTFVDDGGGRPDVQFGWDTILLSGGNYSVGVSVADGAEVWRRDVVFSSGDSFAAPLVLRAFGGDPPGDVYIGARSGSDVSETELAELYSEPDDRFSEDLWVVGNQLIGPLGDVKRTYGDEDLISLGFGDAGFLYIFLPYGESLETGAGKLMVRVDPDSGDVLSEVPIDPCGAADGVLVAVEGGYAAFECLNGGAEVWRVGP